MSITAKLVNGSQKNVEVPDLGITVSELKKLLADAVEIPADEQRLVLRGKVLKDGDILSAVGMEHGNAIHVVRSKKKVTSDSTPAPTTATSAAASSATTTTTASTGPTAPTADSNNPYASLFGGYNTLPSAPGAGTNSAAGGFGAGGMGGFGGMGGGSMEMMQQMAQNPAMMQMASQLMSDPNFMRMATQMNPQLANIPPEQLQMATQMMQNPEAMRQIMSLAGGMQGATGSQGGNNVEGQPAPANSAASGFPMNFGGFPAMAPPVTQGNPREIYRDQLQHLRDMGFPNEEANIAALQQAQGSVSFAIERLLNS